jgi:hypothetical protein
VPCCGTNVSDFDFAQQTNTMTVYLTGTVHALQLQPFFCFIVDATIYSATSNTHAHVHNSCINNKCWGGGDCRHSPIIAPRTSRAASNALPSLWGPSSSSAPLRPSSLSVTNTSPSRKHLFLKTVPTAPQNPSFQINFNF